MFSTIREARQRHHFSVILGGSGAWQIQETDSRAEFGIDTVVSGRAESRDVIHLFHRALAGEPLPPRVDADHPHQASALVVPESRTSFGVVEMTTGCGRRCAFCQPDLNPRISVPKDEIMKAVAGNVAAGNRQVSLATEDMFVWRTDEVGLPFFVPNRTELLDLYRSIVEYPGVEQVTLSHATIAPALVDPDLISGAERSPPRQEPDPAACGQHASRAPCAGAVDRHRDRLAADRQEDHGGEGAAVRHQGLAAHRAQRPRGAEPEQLVPGVHADRRFARTRPTTTQRRRST